MFIEAYFKESSKQVWVFQKYSEVKKNLKLITCFSNKEIEASLLQFDQSVTSEERDDLQHLNKHAEVLQLSENTVIGNKSIEEVSSAPVSTKKDNKVLTLIDDGSTER